MGQAKLETSRLQLVPLAEEHLEFEVELDSDPEVMRYLAPRASSRATTEQAHRNRLALAQRAPGMGLWAGFTTADEFVGFWLLRPREHTPIEGEAELGYRLLRRFWRQGLASEGARELVRHGFEDLGLSRIFAETMAVNLASRATMRSVGLRYVRAFHRERDEPWPGTELDDVEYAITLEEWLRSPIDQQP
jgi:RimJ/RimL family protein N-acetyltransferase